MTKIETDIDYIKKGQDSLAMKMDNFMQESISLREHWATKNDLEEIRVNMGKQENKIWELSKVALTSATTSGIIIFILKAGVI